MRSIRHPLDQGVMITRHHSRDLKMGCLPERRILVVWIFLALCVCQSLQTNPNIVFILTDDQDVEIGGTNPIEKTRKLIGDAGITFKNMFVTTPLCCPSRSSILTGNYVHNHGARNNSISGNCSSPAWQATAEKETFPTYLQKQGYKTFFAGKYLNQYGTKHAGGVSHVPPGWDEWQGLVGNSKYYNFTLSVNGKPEVHGDKYADDYLTDIIARRAKTFIENRRWPHETFFMMLSTPACHAPFTPAPQYSGNFSKVAAPRNGSFNQYSKDKHWLLRAAKHPLSDASLKVIDDVYRNRWRTLLSVDDLVESVVDTLKEKDLLDNTYIFFAADNGYHLGQLSLPYDKRQLYEFDIRVPLMVRGPGIQAGQVREEIILNIDFAPTFVALSGQDAPSTMDGASFKKALETNQSLGDAWRSDFMVEHTGEWADVIDGCPKLTNQRVSNCYPDCVCEDSYNNTYTCVRTISKTENLVYCEFADDEDFVEMYDLKKDPHQLTNIAKTIDPKVVLKQNKRLVQLTICEGPSCRSTEPFPPGYWKAQHKVKTNEQHQKDLPTEASNNGPNVLPNAGGDDTLRYVPNSDRKAQTTLDRTLNLFKPVLQKVTKKVKSVFGNMYQ